MHYVCRLIAAIVIVASSSATGSDHLDSAYLDKLAQLDIGDLFLWTGDQTESPVFLISLNPLTTGAKTQKIALDPSAVYEFKIDTDNDLEADISYKITAEGTGANQTITLRKATGTDAISNYSRDSARSTVVATGWSTPAGTPLNVIKGSNGELLFVGPRQDPFFFNFKGIESPVALDLRFALGGDNLPSDGTAKNTFGPTNVTAIAVEVPELKGKAFGAWSTTSRNGVQEDRCGRASITAIFLPNTPRGRNPKQYPWGTPAVANEPDIDKPKQRYNVTHPRVDRQLYTDKFTYRLGQVQVDPDKIDKLVKFYLPDILQYDPSKAQAYPNGRNLVEDAVYWTLKNINPFMDPPKGASFPQTNPQPLTTTFPYAAPPVNYE